MRMRTASPIFPVASTASNSCCVSQAFTRLQGCVSSWSMPQARHGAFEISTAQPSIRKVLIEWLVGSHALKPNGGGNLTCAEHKQRLRDQQRPRYFLPRTLLLLSLPACAVPSDSSSLRTMPSQPQASAKRSSHFRA